MTNEQKKQLVRLLLCKAGEIVEFDEIYREVPELSELAPHEISRQLGIWLSKLPTTCWDARLIHPNDMK